VAEGSKKQTQYRTNGTTKPETQWFCVHKRKFNVMKELNTKQSAAVFLMSLGQCEATLLD